VTYGTHGSVWDNRWTVNMFCRVAPVQVDVRVVVGDANGEDEMSTSGVCGTRP
jgi:hypothetical protein